MAIGGGTIGPGRGGSNPDSPLGIMPMGQMPNPMPGTLTPEQYQQQFVDYYSFPGIGVEAAPEVDDEEKDDEPVRPDILTPVGQRDEQVANVFGQIPIVGTGQQISTEDPYEYIRNFDTQEKSDLNGKGFSRYLEQAAGVPGAVATVATGLPIAALAYGASGLVRKQHRKNAESIASYGGNAGSMFKFQGQTVSRAPGSKIFSGNLGGLSQSDMYRVDEIRKGFIPGTMQLVGGIGSETAARTGQGGAENGLGGVTSIEGAIMDAFGTVHTGQRDEGGLSMATAGQAQALREKEFRSMARQAGVDISGLKGADFVNAAVAYKQHVDGVMRSDPSHGGFFHKTSSLTAAQNASALENRRNTAIDFLKDKYGITTTPTTTDSGAPSVPSGEAQGQGGGQGGAPQSPSSGRSDDNRPPDVSGGTTPGFGPGGGGPGPRSSDREDRESDTRGGGGPPGGGGSSGYGSTYSSGGGSSLGRRGVNDSTGGARRFAEGGTAQRPLPEAGFVAGPPENFTERETVADDQNGSVAEGTFVINAAAVEFAGSDDIRKMILDAYSTAREKGLDIGRVDRKLYEGTVDVALSKGEVVVPPELAKIIGYDRLEKINNRGKKEVSRRQKKAGGGFLDGKKFADGGEVDYEDRIIADEVRRKMQELLGDLPEDVTVTSEYYKDQPFAKALGKVYSGETVADYQQALADSANMTPLTGRFVADPVDREINVPQTPTLFNLFAMAEEIAHLDYPAERRANPYQDLGSSKSISMGELFNPDAQMQREYMDYDTKFGGNRPFDPYEAFEKEERYREELRAKSIAYETVRGLLPKSKKTADYTKLGYEESFAKYIYDNAPTPIRQGLFTKYPELNKFIDDKGRFVSKRIPIINKGVREFNKRAREVEAQRKK